MSETPQAQTDQDESNDANLANPLIEEVIRLEWEQFQTTTNEGGRAACQGNWPRFHQMRLSQFLTWPEALLVSYKADLMEANESGRNLITEKYGRMMASTAPEEYRRTIEPFIPHLPDDRVTAQEQVIAQQVRWASVFRSHYPRLGAEMRRLTTNEDTPESTSFETYLRGELGTYSDATFTLYRRFVMRLAESDRNLTEETIRHTITIEGYASLDEAEAAQQE